MMTEFEATNEQEVFSVSLTDEGTYYKVGAPIHGLGTITRIEKCEKSGMYSAIPYLRVWVGESVYAEMCQHNVLYVTYQPKVSSEQPVIEGQ